MSHFKFDGVFTITSGQQFDERFPMWHLIDGFEIQFRVYTAIFIEELHVRGNFGTWPTTETSDIEILIGNRKTEIIPNFSMPSL